MTEFYKTTISQLHSFPVTIKLLLGFLIVSALGISQSKSADAQGGCPCGCGGTGTCVLNAASAAQIDDRILSRWTTTATDGFLGGQVASQGNAATLTWGIAQEGSNIASNSTDMGSSLVNFLDGIRDPGSTGGADLTQRNWFGLFEQSANRIAELSGITFNFEANDDGVALSQTVPGGTATGPGGALGTRADIRIGGRPVDGQTGPNTLAFAFFPNSGETVFDTDNTTFFSSTANNSVGFRNVLTHELFHALGVAHVESDNAEFLLNPFINTSFDGPQLDDILVLQRNYGDALEGSNNQAGNDILTNATQLGTLSLGGVLTAGQQVDDTVIGINEVGFLSIDDEADVDFFEFALSSIADVTLELTPEGVTYNQSVEDGTLSALNSQALNDLGLRIFDQSGNLVASSDLFGLGANETISQQLNAGTYFVEVSGSDSGVQLYSLGISALAIAVPEPNSGVLLVGLFTLASLRRRRR